MKLKKIRNALLVVLTLALVSATAVAVTWAYTEGSFSNAENTFTQEGITAQLTEKLWDGGKPDNDSVNLPSTTVKGETMALSYSPNMTIPKNPSITNNSDSSNTTSNDPAEYVAMTVRYYLTNDEGATRYYFSGYTAFKNAIAKVQFSNSGTVTDGFNTNNWDEKDGSDGTVFYYKAILNNWNTSATLFDDVLINPTDTLDSYKNATTSKYTYTGLTKYVVATGAKTADQTFESTGYPEFHIELKGYAVQAYTSAKSGNDIVKTNIGYATAKGELDKLIAVDPVTVALSE